VKVAEIELEQFEESVDAFAAKMTA
jgi:hypothetical protein